MKRHIAVLLVVLAVSCSRREWKEYAFQDAGFAISSPATVRVEKHTSFMTEYSVDLSQGQLFSVLHLELEHAPSTDNEAKSIMDKFANNLAKSGNAKVVSIRDISFAGKPGKAFQLESGPWRTEGRSYQAGLDMYALISRGNPPSSDTERFFSSFRLLH